MSSPTPTEPVSYVKLLREIRDRINEEIADMTTEDRLRWHESQEVSPVLQELFAKATPSSPPHAKRPVDRDE